MMPGKVTIIGLGLIGGSLAKALHDKLGIRDIVAVDTDEQALELAMEQGVISEGLIKPAPSVYHSDIIFICTPVKKTYEMICELTPYIKEGCIITDVGSTKGELLQQVDGMARPPCFIGGHPMAGTERSGYANSYAHLFENAYYVLSPCGVTTDTALETMKSVVEGIGAIPIIMPALEHDRTTGGISHLPHIIASALVNLVSELDQETGRYQTLAAGGFKDITRIASSNPAMWENIVFSNRTQVLDLIFRFRSIMEAFTRHLTDGGANEIYDFFEKARQYRDSISGQAQGLIQPHYRIIIDVQDKPGIIGEIATILGNNQINIKNINVANNREYEQGCLIITLPDTDSVNIAFDLLMNTGYKVYKNR